MNPGDREGDYRMYVEAKFDEQTKALEALTKAVNDMKAAHEAGRSKVTWAIIGILGTTLTGLLIAFVTQLAQQH